MILVKCNYCIVYMEYGHPKPIKEYFIDDSYAEHMLHNIAQNKNILWAQKGNFWGLINECYSHKANTIFSIIVDSDNKEITSVIEPSIYPDLPCNFPRNSVFDENVIIERLLN